MMQSDRGLRGARGITLIEVLLVVIIMAILIISLEPLVRHGWQNWVIADRRAELTATGRTAMSRIVDEIRLAYDLHSATTTNDIDYYPQWSTATFSRFLYDPAPAYDLHNNVATPTFASASLAAPIDSFSYVSYTRKLDENLTTTARRLDAFKFVFAVSDSRHILPQPPTLPGTLNPLTFRSQAQMRMSREGYKFAKDATFKSESFVYSYPHDDIFCVKLFNDRVNPAPASVSQAYAQVTFGVAPAASRALQLQYNPTDDYYATCCHIKSQCKMGQASPAQIYIYITDDLEYSIMRDIITIGP